MGCALSKQDDVVSVCRKRKKLLKLAVERRYAFAEAQSKYNQSLYGVAMALRLFVSRHSYPDSPFLITFPTSSAGSFHHKDETFIADSMFLQQVRPSQPTLETINACQDSYSSKSSLPKKQESQELYEEDEEESECEDTEEVCEHFYGGEDDKSVHCEQFYGEVGGVPSMVSSSTPQKGFGWDFFYPFDELRTEEVNAFRQNSDDDWRAVREKEGIPDLEEDGEGVESESEVVNMKNGFVGVKGNEAIDDRNGVGGGKVGPEESNGLTVIDTPTNGRELLDALKDVEDHFVRAHDSGLEISRMLEANRVQLQSGLEDLKESSNKLIRSLIRSRSALSSSSCKSLLTSSTMSSLMWTDSKDDIFDNCQMVAGSHSLTLGRLYAWEKKLYQEVKAGDLTRKALERKCSHLKNKDTKRDGAEHLDKCSDEVKDLHARISVAIRSAESISDRIQKLRDEELQPQLLELLHGLLRSWKIMLESHEKQNRVMLEVNSFNFTTHGKICNDSHRLATIQLEAELDNWRHCFASYVSTQKEYIRALSGWLSKFVDPEFNEVYYGGQFSIPASGIDGPPLLVTCHNWLAFLEKLPNKAVTGTMKSFVRDIQALVKQQGEEQQQKRKVDSLAKEHDRKTLAFHRAKKRFLESKISELQPDTNVQNSFENLAEKKILLDLFKKRLESEQVKHHTSMQETHGITINGFQTGFSSVFESLTEFSKASVKIYADLLRYSGDDKTAEEQDGNLSYVEGTGSQVSS